MEKNKLHGFSLSTIRSKLIIWFLIVGLLPLGIVSAILYSLNSKELVQKEQAALESLTLSTAQGMEQWIERRLSEVQLAAKTDAMLSLTPERQLALVKTVKDQSPTYETVVFTAPDGTVQAHTTEANIGVMNLSDREYFISGMNGESTISSVLTSKATGNRIVVVASPVQGENGDILGVMSASINFEDLINQFLGSTLSETIDPILVDNQNVFQVYSQKDWIGKNVSETDISSGFISLIEQGKKESGNSVIKEQGKEYVITYTPIDLAGYGLYFKTSMDSILSATDQSKYSTLVISGLSMIGILMIALIVARRISRPIKLVTEHVQQIANGDLTGKALRVSGKDEISKLTESINIMLINLQDLIRKVGDSSEHVADFSEELTASAEQTKTYN
ncbi:cache domain-containing protein [Metabacillus bambusae]|uniref:histidine kinase n=1 Tax=Metabacillus bambusae TaxID=2795218 RepID=A0ABS3MW88_9BACI|nr:cache domain-containing protein [Metabacillus bambusae]MBO1510208.1 HAMP domain-containing protein [Metabacillus bambusae]